MQAHPGISDQPVLDVSRLPESMIRPLVSGPDLNRINVNIVLADGSWTRPDKAPFEQLGQMKAALRTVAALFPDREPSSVSLVDLGCLEGGYTFGFARAGYPALGLEARQLNYAKCEWIRKRAGLDNVSFVRDDARNLPNYGTFDVVYCSGLLYHLDDPAEFLDMLARCTRRALILHTHYTTPDMSDDTLARLGQFSPEVVHKVTPGRWYKEYEPWATSAEIEANVWASWGNDRSFWMDRRHLLQTLRDVGFDAVYEQLDFLDNVVTDNFIQDNSRSMFVAVKTPR
jgi:SAM-dependent methyltransferase